MKHELPEDFKYHYNKANQLSEGLMVLKDKETASMNIWNKVKSRKAIKHYKKCIKLIPDHWPTHWLIAKIYQALKDHNNALYHFKMASDINKINPDLPREASISAMDFGQVELALKFSYEAIQRDPNDSGLLCNHAINLMVNGDDNDALHWINKALEINPNDIINKNAFALIQKVANKKVKRPRYDQII